jgi:hypothetical protein
MISENSLPYPEEHGGGTFPCMFLLFNLGNVREIALKTPLHGDLNQKTLIYCFYTK